MKRSALALALLVLPAAAGAQGFSLRPPDLGEAYRTMDRLHAHRVERRPEDLDQTFVFPERPGQNQVAWYEFDWHYLDVPPPGGGPGGIRLYYYKSALPQARKALPAILSAYARLVEEFHYNPTKRIPYILYSTQREFQTQNVFEVTESVLGVTSPQDLKMTVPYFGDHSRFVEVSTHEMVHQFTIQKLMEAAGAEDIGSPIYYLPLWFIEGIAEWYSKGGLDTETETYLRDLVVNPDPRRGYEVLPFAEDRLRGYIPTYKLGQARIAFIAEEYGKEKVQGFLENAYQLADGGSGGGGNAPRSFAGLVRRVLNEPIEQVDARWRTWMKRRYYPAFVAARHDLSQLKEYRQLPAEPEAFSASPDGNVLLVRGIDRQRGRAALHLVDLRNTKAAVQIATDNRPGFESLHPVEYGIGAVGNGLLAFSAQAGIGDRLYVQAWRSVPREKGAPRLDTGRRRALEVRTPDGGPFLVIADPAFSPDTKRIAFVGVARDGQQDIYTVGVAGGTATRVTNDGFAEKDLAWSKDGIYFSSDATDHGRLNLFRVDPDGGNRVRLTTAPATDRYPRPLADGGLLFASDLRGKPDLWILRDGTMRQVSDTTTGVAHPAVAPADRGALAGIFYGGVFRLVELPRVSWLEGAAVPIPPAAGDPLPIPSADFPPDVPAYSAWKTFRPEAAIVYGGGASSGVAGRAAVLFDDLLRDHVLFVDVSVYGRFDYTQGIALYEDKSRRTGLVLGGYHFVQQNLDRLDPSLTFLQREFGVLGALRFPLDRFRRFETELTLGGVQRYCVSDDTSSVFNVCQGIRTNDERPYGASGDANAEWHRLNGGVHLTLNPTVRFGYDSIRYDPLTGPLAGQSLLAELGAGWIPDRSAVTGFFRFDAEQYFQLVGRAKFMLRASGGTSFSPDAKSRPWERSWWLSSSDNLRGFEPFELDYLIGENYYVANAELHFPLDPLLRLLFFDYLEGVLALDFGGVFNRLNTVPSNAGPTAVCKTTTRDRATCIDPGAWDARTLTGVVGVNFLFGPLLLRLHFGHPFDIGGIETQAMRDGTRWVTNLTLRYAFF